MRPHNDIAQPDATEVIHHLRESQAKWQETAGRLRQRCDTAESRLAELVEAAEDYFHIIERCAWMDDPRGDPLYNDRADRLQLLLYPGDRVPDGASQVTG